MHYKCSLCQKNIEGDMMVYMDHTQNHIIDLVKHDHPEWVEANGLCRQCYEYYKGEIDGSIFKDAPCALRIRKVKGAFEAIAKVLTGKKQ